MKIGKGKVVSIDYTLTDARGEILDSSKGNTPLSYIQGHGNIIPGLENSLEGRSAGDSFKLTVPPKDAYGEREEGRTMHIKREQFKGVDDLEVGMQFHAQGEGGPQVVTITAIEGDTVTVDGNHPLSGMTLNFDVSVVEVRDATKEELEHGHVHGPGGHH
jgi:FKBP-type peptidyl-prolyl cis-trans isomerase SlyD